MIPVGLDELARASPWPARLLGLAPWESKPRSHEKVLREYDVDKYGPLLARLDAGPATPEELQRMLESSWEKGTRPVSMDGRLYAMERSEFEAQRRAVYRDLVAPLVADADAVLDLGCGFGYKLWLLREHTAAPMWGGDLAANAARVAARLFAPEAGIRVQAFDLDAPEDYDRLFAAAGDARRIAVFTCHAVEQTRTARTFVGSLKRHRARIARVVQLEPATGLLDSGSLLDQMRLAYAIRNDYNRDLLETLRDDEDVQVERVQKDVLGANPLFPVSLLSWRFASP